MIRLRNISLRPGESEALLKTRAAKQLRLRPEEITELVIRKKSIDARKKRDIRLVYTLDVETSRPVKNAEQVRETPYSLPVAEHVPESRPVVAGFGPAGIFAALLLARAGLRPLVIERGADVDTRSRRVGEFWQGGALDTETNVQFGEGGAGAFSDGKLTTGISDPRVPFVLETFHRAGAQESILYDARPHIGSDVLPTVVRTLREEIISLGGEIRFNTRLEGLKIENGSLCAVTLSDGTELETQSLILAIGHSARDTFEMLEGAGVPMQPKAFSMGVRIEHLQSEIDAAQYGEFAEKLPAADYKLSCRFDDGTSAYTFCMCPGGYVVASASEEGGLVTNGMSELLRDGENANSALLVTLTPDMFPDRSTLGGMRWQRELEGHCFRHSGSYLAPAQLVGDFLEGRASSGAGNVIPSYRPGVVWCDLNEILPDEITAVLKRAIPELGRKLKGFDSPEAVLTAPETRSSSPVRILRDEGLQSEIKGLYPCGEGAGYAGGIMSAAVDGLRCAERLIGNYNTIL